MRTRIFLGLVLICFILILFSGCLDNSSVSPTIQNANGKATNIIPSPAFLNFNINTNTTGSDPFIGCWWNHKGGLLSERVFPNGSITIRQGDFGTLYLNGTWKKIGTNTYFVRLYDSPYSVSGWTTTYYPETDTIIDDFFNTSVKRVAE